tara:strand:+ start:463 stop:684 length:222 start_codon:yes stop_codon:yes gene_type:complete
MNSVTKEKTITLNLTSREAQAILSAARTFYEDDIKPAKTKNQLAFFWRLIYKDFEKGINKAGEQYDKQISKGE